MPKRSRGQSASATTARAPKARWKRVVLAGGLTAAGALAVVVFLRSGGLGEAQHAYALAPESVLPADIRRASAEVVEAYRFAIANQATLRYIPCYCGCGAEGHTSNASCYLKDFSTPENMVFDRMSLT